MWDDNPEMSGSEIENFGQPYPAAVSDIGCEREINEDRYACFSFGDCSVWLVCDGMGGAVGGELAAQLAIDTIKKVLETDPSNISHSLLVRAFNEANRVVVLRRQNPAFSGMGTTIVGVVVTPKYISVMHAGDSRAYVLTDNAFEQVTTDHTYVQDLVAKGMISQSEALQHPQSHVLTRCLGGQLKLDFDDKQFAITPVNGRGDVIVLCSDGLYSLINDDEIAHYVNEFSPQLACAKLVELARARGGYDNITVAVIPIGSKVDLEGNEEIHESVLLSQRNKKSEARVLSRPAEHKKEFSIKTKVLLMAGLGFLTILSVFLLFMLW